MTMMSMDVESASRTKVVDESASGHNTTNIVEAQNEGTQSDMSRKIGSRKYASLRTDLNEEVPSNKDLTEERVSSSLTNGVNSDSQHIASSASSSSSSAIGSRWESMMHGFRSLRSNIDSKRFLPLGNAQTTTSQHSPSSFESLDEIFERLKRPPSEYKDYGD